MPIFTFRIADYVLVLIKEYLQRYAPNDFIAATLIDKFSNSVQYTSTGTQTTEFLYNSEETYQEVLEQQQQEAYNIRTDLAIANETIKDQEEEIQALYQRIAQLEAHEDQESERSIYSPHPSPTYSAEDEYSQPEDYDGYY